MINRASSSEWNAGTTRKTVQMMEKAPASVFRCCGAAVFKVKRCYVHVCWACLVDEKRFVLEGGFLSMSKFEGVKCDLEIFVGTF